MMSKSSYSGVPTHDDGQSDQMSSSNGNGNGNGVHPSAPTRSPQHAYEHRIDRGLPRIAFCLLAAAAAIGAGSYALRRPNQSDTTPPACSLPPVAAASTGQQPSHSSPSTTDKYYYPHDPAGSDGPWPRIAWVMSFPNSGTSYTMRLIQRMTNQTAASNYGKECDVDAKTGNNYPVYDYSKDGPFWSQPFKRKIPTRYVVTKTHCGGYTTDSGPDKYVHTTRSFMVQCLTGNRIAPTFDENGNVVKARGTPLAELTKLHTTYDPNLVQRAVHVVRDPFDNIVSRFHLEQHVHTKQKKKEWLEKYPSTPKGFQNWCRDMDAKHEKEEGNSRFMDETLRSAFGGVPCHGEFYRYVQWHNLALTTTRKMRLPTLILNYETFEDDFDGTYDELFNFLELPRDGSMTEFVVGKKYRMDYFDANQRREAMKLVRLVTEPDMWEILKRYDQ